MHKIKNSQISLVAMNYKMNALALLLALVMMLVTSLNGSATPTLPPGNTAEQWNTIAENTVVGSGAFQAEGLIYMGYVSSAVYNAVVAIEGGYEPFGSGVTAAPGASTDAAVIEAAYRTLVNYFPAQAGTLGSFYSEALASIPDSAAKTAGQAVGLASATDIINMRNGDGRLPIGAPPSFPTLPPGPGVWRRTPPFQSPQTPWVGSVRPFIVPAADRFLPDPPPLLQSNVWVEAFNQIKALGAMIGSARTDEQTTVAKFWSANVDRQYNRLARDVVDSGGLGLLDTARLMAMVNVVGADALISCFFAKYHYLFWRPVTAIDPTAVTADGFGPAPGFDDGNPETIEQVGWRPLLQTPNHPEYPAAHGTITSAEAEVFSNFLSTNSFNLDIHGFDASGQSGNLNAIRHFEKAKDLRHEIVDARLWAGLHYHFSSVAGLELGRNVANYDLRNAFRAIR